MTFEANKWQPHASRSVLVERALLLNQIRSFFNQADVLEVDTPSLSNGTITDPHLEPISAELGTDKPVKLYLQTSPEYAMKRLLASGCGDIFQICKAFRNDEHGRKHNSEFTLLEWYRIGFDPAMMLDEIESLLTLVLGISGSDRVRYADLFLQHLEIDIETVTDSELGDVLESYCSGLRLENRDDILMALFATCIEPSIGQHQPCFVTHYPASQASLAKLYEDEPKYAQRFEVYFKGVELANGFGELSDSDEQQKRFEQDNLQRLKSGKPEMPIDSRLIDALKHGLPNCTGVALGIDRLLMLKLGKDSIKDVLAFDVSNA